MICITKGSCFQFYQKYYKSRACYQKAELTLTRLYEDILNYDYAFFYKLQAEFEYKSLLIIKQ